MHLNYYGPELGYFSNAKKCWIVVKPLKRKGSEKHLRTLLSTLQQTDMNTLDQHWVQDPTQVRDLGKRGYQASSICIITAPSKLCCLHFWNETSLDVLSSDDTRHCRPSRATGKSHLIRTLSSNNRAGMQ